MACKVITTMGMKDYIVELMDKEMKTMEKLSGKHPNLLEVFEIRKAEDLRYYIYTEYCSGDTLMKAEQMKHWKTEADVKDVMSQLVSCLKYLHSQRIVHADLKPENICFLNETDNTIKLLDFGLAYKRNNRKEKNQRGSLYYMAPEVYFKKGYTEAADIWSVGVIMYEILVGERLMKPGMHLADIKRKLKKIFPTHMKASEEAQSVVKDFLQFDPVLRPTAGEILKHPWFTNNDDTERLLSKGAIFNLGEYARRGALQKALMPVMMKRCTIKNDYLMEHVKKIFHEADKDHDEEIDFSEFVSCIKKVGGIADEATEEILQEIFDSLDDDGDSTISLQELMGWFEYRYITSQDERLWAFIASLDKTGKGKVSLQDIEQAIRECNDGDLLEDVEVLRQTFSKNERGYESFADIFRNDQKSNMFSEPRYSMGSLENQNNK